MRRLLLWAGLLAGLGAASGHAFAIDVQATTYGGAAALVGADIVDTLDTVVKPCDCENPPNPGVFFVTSEGGGLVPVHYEAVEGTTIRTVDGATVGTVLAVMNLDGGGAIILVVRVVSGLIGTVERLNIRRTAFYWTGAEAVINTTLDDLRASLLTLGVGA